MKIELTSQEKRSLEEQHRKTRDGRIRDRLKAVLLSSEGLVDGADFSSTDTQKAAKERGIEVYYLPPYSPNLNPIERCWKIMNEQVRNNRFFPSAKEFREAIMRFFNVTWNTIAAHMTDRVNDSFQRISTAHSV